MRIVYWEDRHGFKRASWVRDGDPDDLAPEGIPAGPPDFAQISWNDISRELNNTLIKKGVLTWKDVQREQNAVTNALTRILRREIISLYRQAEPSVQPGGIT